MLGRDSWQLLSGVLWKQHQHITWRDVVVSQAGSNAVARSIVQWEKERALMQYHGWTVYLRHKLSGSPGGGSGTRSIGDSMASATESKPTARVAFMVTSAQKEELKERLGYTADQIKKMTPVEASLTLHHNVEPSQAADGLPGLVQSFQDQQQKEAEQRIQEQKEAEERIRKQEAEQKMMKEQMEASMKVPDETETEPRPTGFLTSLPFASRNELADESMKKTNDERIWWEIMETDSKGETSRVALYLDREEAEAGLEVRRSLAENRQSVSTFQLRQREREPK